MREIFDATTGRRLVVDSDGNAWVERSAHYERDHAEALFMNMFGDFEYAWKGSPLELPLTSRDAEIERWWRAYGL